jgi:hypothetical protein
MSSARRALPFLEMQNLEKFTVIFNEDNEKFASLLLDSLHLKRHQSFKAVFIQMRKVDVLSRFRCLE